MAMPNRIAKEITWPIYSEAFFRSPSPMALEIRAVVPVAIPEPSAMIMKKYRKGQRQRGKGIG